ncbi:hypothetical protein JTB14_010222 [Gonioctena quinquepunctata]|nr:hypothetical protein JTB14_010222 [Gonioctena quinquepunctata]
MSIRERLKLAYENVAYGADKTWSTEFSSLQKSNMDLIVRESQLQEPKPIELRPRTVRDCIPQSKLAKYSNYEYNDSRELSYTMEDFKVSQDFPNESIDKVDGEPWMLKEVDDFYKFYTDYYKNTTGSECSENSKVTCVTTNFESPFLKSNSLAEYFLKHQVSKDEVKKLWDASNGRSKSFMFRSYQSIRGEKSFVVYKSPAGQVFVSESDDVTSELKEDYYEWCKDDVDHFNILSNSFKDQIKNSGDTSEHILDSQADSAQNRRLYSAVLQGYSSKSITHESSEGQMTILKRNAAKSDQSVMEKLGSISDFGKKKPQNNFRHIEEPLHKSLPFSTPKLFPNSPLASSRSVQTTSTTSDKGINRNLFPTNHEPYFDIFQDTKMTQNTFTPTIHSTIPHQIGTARYRPSYISSGYQYPSFYMFIQNSFQQNFLQPFYTPMMLHRTVQPTFERSFPQRTFQVPVSPQYNIVPSNFVTQNKFNLNVQRFDRHLFKSKGKEKAETPEKKRAVPAGGGPSSGNIRKSNDNFSCSSMTSPSEISVGEANNDIDYLVSRTIDLVLDESKSENIVTVSGSPSDELERQALEQYNNSCDNVFQELERQAAEEYEFSSENCNSPPNLDFLFGGFSNEYKFCFI